MAVSRTTMLARRLAMLALLVSSLAAAGGGCGPEVCTEIGCSSVAEVSYGSRTLAEPYLLTITPNGPSVTALCLGAEGEEPLPPDWLACDGQGFTITGSEADLLTVVSVTVVPVESGEALIANELVTLDTLDIEQPNGPDCEPTCYVRSGTVPEPPEP